MAPAALFSLLFFFIVSPANAAPTELNAVWYARNYEALPIKKVLVIGLSPDPKKRRQFETAFVKRIRDAGGKAEISLDVLPAGQNPSKDVVVAALNGKDFDAVFVCRVLDIELRPGYTPIKPENANFDAEYQELYKTSYTPGATKEARNFLLQLRIFSVKETRLIWSAESEMFNPASMEDLVASIGKAMRKDLLDKGFIRPQ